MTPRVFPAFTIGLPVIGPMLHNDQYSGVTSRYGGMAVHACSVVVQ
jgi:hypothetical protein